MTNTSPSGIHIYPPFRTVIFNSDKWKFLIRGFTQHELSILRQLLFRITPAGQFLIFEISANNTGGCNDIFKSYMVFIELIKFDPGIGHIFLYSFLNCFHFSLFLKYSTISSTVALR
nr:MAG TPA: hypothetical protein [Bacteriophage sp.]